MENTTPSPEPNIELKAQNAFRLKSIENMRDSQREIYDNFDFSPSDDVSEEQRVESFLTDVDEQAKQHLIANGITEDDPKFDDYLAALSPVSYGRMNNMRWRYGTRENGVATSFDTGRESIRQKQLELFGKDIEAGPDADVPDAEVNPDLDAPEPDSERDPAIESARASLVDLRRNLALITAKRQGKAFSLFNEKYNDARAKYNEQLQNLAKLELADQLALASTDTERNTIVIGHLLEEQARLRTLTKEQLAGTKVSKFIEFMNKGGIAKRIIKGVALGAGVGFVAATVGSVVAAGAGIAAIGSGITTAAALGSRFARGFAARDNREGRGMDQLVANEDRLQLQSTLDASDQDHGDMIDTGIRQLDKRFDFDTKKEQAKRRKSIKWGVGGIALGSVVGYGIHELTGPWLGHDQPGAGNDNSSGTPDNSTVNPGADNGSPDSPINNPGETYHDSHDIIPSPNTSPDGSLGHPPGTSTIPGNGLPKIPLGVEEYSLSSETIQPGEGWYQTFSELGVTNAQQQTALLQSVGPKLQELGIAYRDPHIGGYGISHPGTMPEAALDVIHKAAVSKGYLVS